MARSNSTQHKLDRVRPPRVHVTYDVEVGDAIEELTPHELWPLPTYREMLFVK